MKNVHILHHVRNEDEEGEDVKLIGAYSSKERALSAIERLKEKPGFREFPDGFHVDQYQLDLDHWVEGFGSPAE